MTYKNPSLYAIKLLNKDFAAEIRYDLKEIDGYTQLNSETVMEFYGNFIERFIGKMAAHHNKQDMKKLINLVEKA